MPDRIPVAVIGAGQAGLATSYYLTASRTEHVVLERGRVGETWRTRRWDTFTLVTPNWTVQLPGRPYDGDQPNGFMRRSEIVEYLERYATAVSAPVRDGIEVSRLEPIRSGGFRLHLNGDVLEAGQVVVATGAFQRPQQVTVNGDPPGNDISQLHTDAYRAPDHLPDGAVLMVGSGQSGCQIGDELQLSGRQVYLAAGSCGWVHRVVGGHDIAWWLRETGFYERTADQMPEPPNKFACNPQATGKDGGYDLNLRTLARIGVVLAGRLRALVDHRAVIADDLSESVAKGDQFWAKLRQGFEEYARSNGLHVPEAEEPLAPLADPHLTEFDLRAHGVRSVVWASGYRPDFSWINLPIFGSDGYPLHDRGVSSFPGLYFVGLPGCTSRSRLCFTALGKTRNTSPPRSTGEQLDFRYGPNPGQRDDLEVCIAGTTWPAVELRPSRPVTSRNRRIFKPSQRRSHMSYVRSAIDQVLTLEGQVAAEAEAIAPHGANTVRQAWRETEAPAPEGGLRVRQPRSGSQAQRAGLHADDLVVAIDATAITTDLDTAAVQGAIRAHASGEEITLAVRRGPEEEFKAFVRRP